MPYAPAGDIELHYEIRGRGAPLLLLAGEGATPDLWGGEFLDALARHFKLVLPDTRGTGLSPRGGGPYTIARLADDAARVLDAAGLLTAHVLGMSMGGMVAQELAATHPARVRALVLGSTTAGGEQSAPPRRSALEEIPRQGLLGISSLLVTPEFTARRTGLLTRLAVRSMVNPIPAAVLSEQVAAMTAFDMTGRLGQILAPTLIMAGDRDQIIPPENARILARGIRGARGAFVKDTAHCFYWEAPERAARAITDFLLPLSPATPSHEVAKRLA